MSDFTTWIRVEDAYAQFDHPKGEPLPKGVSAVKDSEDYVGPWARPSKPKTDKAGEPVTPSIYDSFSKAELEDEIAGRNAEREDADKIAATPPGNKPDLIAALVADDAE